MNSCRFLLLFLLSMGTVAGTASGFRYSKSGSDFMRSCLQVSDNGRYLQYDDGTPFFYLGDTAWELFHRLTREEADRYLEDRAAKGFTVIQAVALAEIDGLTVPNAYGSLPLEGKDPSRPLTDTTGYDYWDHVDYVVDKANRLGLYVGLLPTWGSHWHDRNPVFTPENAEAYGRFLGQRYREAKVIWILGGDRVPENDRHRAIIRAMAHGLDMGDGGSHLCTYHPGGGRGSATYFHKDGWLDFNMRQNGHVTEYSRYGKTLDDYHMEPVKPVLDGEPLYEDHPVSFDARHRGHSVSADVRRALYWDLFNGACGHTYGHHSVWQMSVREGAGRNSPLMAWTEALQRPGSSQMMHARRLLESRPYFTRIPATDRVLVKGRVPTAMPGEGVYHFAATCDTEGTYAMVYAPVGRAFTVRMSVIKNGKVKAWWFNPRTGKAHKAGTYSNRGERTFVCPDDGELTDWVLVLDDASAGYPTPGK